MEKLPRIRYSPEFREQAMRLYHESELALEDAAKRLSRQPFAASLALPSIPQNQVRGLWG